MSQHTVNYSFNCWIHAKAEPGEGSGHICQNPSSGLLHVHGNFASMDQLERAVLSSQKALGPWRAMSAADRWQVLQNWKEHLSKRQESLLECLMQETGKPHWDCEAELRAFFAKWDLTWQAYVERASPIQLQEGSVTYRSHGIFAVLGPFNFPLHLPNGQILPALLSGGCVIFKPSEYTPCISELYVESAYQAGLPAGTLNLIQGGPEIGSALAIHPKIDAVLFTGSRKAGQAIYQALSPWPHKLVALELGGNNPLIVTSVTNEEAACAQIILSAFISSGQRCTCARRLLLIDNFQNRRLLAKLIEKTSKLRLGSPQSTPIPFMGPLIHERACYNALDFQKRLLERTGKAHLMAEHQKPGAWLTPGIIELKTSMMLADEECFAPILQVGFVKDLEEAIQAANSTCFGLSAGILSDSRADFDHFLREIRAGVVSWNEPTTGASSRLPFGGIGSSGNHRTGGYFMIDSCVWPMSYRINPELTMPKTPLYGNEDNNE